MAMLKCQECGEYVSEFARACPNCGCPMSDIAQENQVDDRNWDPNQTKRKTNTQVYSQEELNRALEEARAGQSRQQRKPGQERVVKNSESALAPKSRKKKSSNSNSGSRSKGKKQSKEKNWKALIILIVILVLIAGGLIYYFVMASSDRPKDSLGNDSDAATEETYSDYNSYENNDSYDDNNDDSDDDAVRETQRSTRETTRKQTQRETTKRQTTKQTTRQTTTAQPTTQPATEAPAEQPEEPLSE